MPTHNNDSKKKFLNEHFAYEVQMIIAAHQIHNAGATLFQANQIEIVKYIWYKNIGIEGVLMHVRNLIEFYFDPVDNSGKYAKALDYLPDVWATQLEEYKKNNPNVMEVVNNIRDRTNDEIVHLGWERLNKTPLNKGWRLDDISIQFIGLALAFINLIKADGKYYGEGLRQLESQIQVFYT
jgi:hypothetical protein